MKGPEIELDAPDPDEVRDRFSRTIATAIVVGTLAAALVGYLQTRAGDRAGEAGVAAQGYGSRAMGELLRSQQVAQVDFENYALAEQERRRAASARQQFIFLSGDDERRGNLARERWERLAEQTSKDTAIAEDRPDGPQLDPAFPTQFFANSEHESIRLQALQDAANEEDAAWSGKESTYTAILTLFAVALYLLGLSLTVKVGVRRMFAGLGIALIVVGSAWAATVSASSPQRPSAEAAKAYADGRVKLDSATTKAQNEAAAADFSRAIELRPTFALAYQGRADAVFAAGAQQGQGLLSISTPEAVESSTEDLRRALELGLRNRNILGSLGFHEFLLGLSSKDDAEMQRSIDHTEEAIALDESAPVLWFNKAVALLALDRPEEARQAYDRALRLTIFTDVEAETPSQDVGAIDRLVSGALTDLELLAAARPDLAGIVAEMKERVVTAGSMFEFDLAEEPEAIPSIEVDVFPAEVQWVAELPGYTEDDVVSQQWYYQDDQGLGWSGLPNVSGLAFPSPNGDTGGYFDLRNYLASSFPAQCLSAGRYRVELYVNGRLAGTGEAEVPLQELLAYVPRDVNVATCRPPDWVRSESATPGLLDGFVSPSGDRGVYVFRYTPPRGDAGFDLLDQTIEIFDELFPGEGAPVFDADEGTDTNYFLGLEDPRKRWYDFPGGFVRAGSGRSDDGAIVVALVFGPEDWMSRQGQDGLLIIDSLVEYDSIG